jgi:hypothetical protein
MNLQIFVPPPARVEPWHKDERSARLHVAKVTLHSAITSVDFIVTSGFAANDQAARPSTAIYSTAALEGAVWMVPDGDGWAEVYGDGDGWPVWDVEMWAPAVSYSDGRVVPDGDGWSPYESHNS